MEKTKQQYVWNIAEVLRDNPVSKDRELTRTFLVDGKYCTALVVQAQPQSKPFIHVHKDHEEFLYLLEGEGWVYIGDEKFEVRAGDLVYCPAGVQHGFFIPTKGVRLSIYGPPFDREHPDRFVPNGRKLVMVKGEE